jgi:hypothetical protein
MGVEKPLTLAPLKFKEAVADLLKVKPPPKPKKAKRSKAPGGKTTKRQA